MLAYKFRSPAQIDFALDILFNNRLYCSEWSRMNDPMEGVFAFSHSSTDEIDWSKKVDNIEQHKQQIRICSLSKTFDCHLLWAHYADGFSGLAIEVELPDPQPWNNVKEVTYRGVFAGVSSANKKPSKRIAQEILSSKYMAWSYEEEVRILNDAEWYNLQSPVRRIIVGHRMNPSLFQGLRIICERQGITVNRTGIGDEGIDADQLPPLEPMTKAKRMLNRRGRSGRI